jgi:Fe2+ transport system protein FeoA
MEILLVQLKIGKTGKIKRIEGGAMFQKKMASLNIRIGKEIRRVVSQPFRGPVVVEIDRRRITLGRCMAMRIFVEVGQ